MNPAFFGVRFENFPENAQFNATPKVIISSTQTNAPWKKEIPQID